MSFNEAQDYQLRFGLHKGKRLFQVADEPGGLQYLDYLLGQDLFQETKAAITEFLANPVMKRDLELAIEEAQ